MELVLLVEGKYTPKTETSVSLAESEPKSMLGSNVALISSFACANFPEHVASLIDRLHWLVEVFPS